MIDHLRQKTRTNWGANTVGNSRYTLLRSTLRTCNHQHSTHTKSTTLRTLSQSHMHMRPCDACAQPAASLHPYSTPPPPVPHPPVAACPLPAVLTYLLTYLRRTARGGALPHHPSTPRCSLASAIRSLADNGLLTRSGPYAAPPSCAGEMRLSRR